MPTLSARYVKQGRRVYHCDWCERRIVGQHMYLYGMAHDTEKPTGMRLHIDCCQWEPKVAKALGEATSQDVPANVSNDAEDRYNRGGW